MESRDNSALSIAKSPNCLTDVAKNGRELRIDILLNNRRAYLVADRFDFSYLYFSFFQFRGANRERLTERERFLALEA